MTDLTVALVGSREKVGVADQLGNQCFYVRGIHPSVDTNGNV